MTTSTRAPAQHQNDTSQRADAVQSLFHERNGPLVEGVLEQGALTCWWVCRADVTSTLIEQCAVTVPAYGLGRLPLIARTEVDWRCAEKKKEGNDLYSR